MWRRLRFAEVLQVALCVTVVAVLAGACSVPTAFSGSEAASGSAPSSPEAAQGDGSDETIVSNWDVFWPEFSTAAATQDSLATADLTKFPYPNPWGEPLDQTEFVREYDSLFPEEVRGAFAQPGENLTLDIGGSEILVQSELQRIGEGGYPDIEVDITTARVFVVSEISTVEGFETNFHYVFDLVDGEYRFIADFAFG